MTCSLTVLIMSYKHDLLQLTEIMSWHIYLWRRRHEKIFHTKWWKFYIGVRYYIPFWL